MNLEKRMIGYVKDTNIKYKRWQDSDSSNCVYNKVRILPVRLIMRQDEAKSLTLNREEKDWFDNYF